MINNIYYAYKYYLTDNPDTNFFDDIIKSKKYENTKKVKRVGEAEFCYLLKRIFFIKFKKTFQNLMNIKEYFPWKS